MEWGALPFSPTPPCTSWGVQILVPHGVISINEATKDKVIVLVVNTATKDGCVKPGQQISEIIGANVVLPPLNSNNTYDLDLIW